jgi:hypothetical protein
MYGRAGWELLGRESAMPAERPRLAGRRQNRAISTNFAGEPLPDVDYQAASRTLLVVSIHSSDNEVGGQWGQVALARLKDAVGRVESS